MSEVEILREIIYDLSDIIKNYEMCEHCSLRCIATGCECICHSPQVTKEVNSTAGKLPRDTKHGGGRNNAVEQPLHAENQLGEMVMYELIIKDHEGRKVESIFLPKIFVDRIKEYISKLVQTIDSKNGGKDPE